MRAALYQRFQEHRAPFVIALADYQPLAYCQVCLCFYYSYITKETRFQKIYAITSQSTKIMFTLIEFASRAFNKAIGAQQYVGNACCM